MKRRAMVGLLFLSTVLTGCQGAGLGTTADVVIGSKDFTEQIILGELLAQFIEATTSLKVDRRLQLGGTFVCHEALKAGQLDAYIEYTGTAFTAILGQAGESNPQEVYRRVKDYYERNFDLEVTAPLGFENTFAIVVRGQDARQFNLTNISDLKSQASRWRAGFGYEFLQREDGFPGLSQTYGLQFDRPPQVMDLGLIYRALVEKQVDVVAGSSTDAQISRLDLVILRDDRQYFPPYEAVPIVRRTTLEKYPQLRQVLAKLGGFISVGDIQKLNYEVEGELRPVKEAVQQFLLEKGVVSARF